MKVNKVMLALLGALLAVISISITYSAKRIKEYIMLNFIFAKDYKKISLNTNCPQLNNCSCAGVLSNIFNNSYLYHCKDGWYLMNFTSKETKRIGENILVFIKKNLNFEDEKDVLAYILFLRKISPNSLVYKPSKFLKYLKDGLAKEEGPGRIIEVKFKTFPLILKGTHVKKLGDKFIVHLLILKNIDVGCLGGSTILEEEEYIVNKKGVVEGYKERKILEYSWLS